MPNPAGAELAAVLIPRARSSPRCWRPGPTVRPRRAGLGAGTERREGIGMQECSVAAGTGLCSQESVNEGHWDVSVLALEGTGWVCGYALDSRYQEHVSVPGMVDVPELLGSGSCGYNTGPGKIEMCGSLLSPIRGWQGGK